MWGHFLWDIEVSLEDRFYCSICKRERDNLPTTVNEYQMKVYWIHMV